MNMNLLATLVFTSFEKQLIANFYCTKVMIQKLDKYTTIFLIALGKKYVLQIVP